MDYRENTLRSSRVNLNKVGASWMEQKCNRQYYVNIIISAYLSCNQQDRLDIDEAGLRLMERTFHQQFYLFSNHDTSNISNISNLTVNSSLASQTKCDNISSDLQTNNIFSHFLGTYLVYIFLIIECGNYPLTSKRGRCRNVLSIAS